MIIIETCPICGCDLIDTIVATNPPMSRKECLSCGWSSTDKSNEHIIRIPFRGNSYIPSPCRTCRNHPNNGGSGNCNCILGVQTFY